MIEIKYDCPESSSEMVKTECGFYCSSCNQEVYDFTDKSLDEITKINANNPSISCGVFTEEQAIVNVRSSIQNLFRTAFAAIFVLGLNVTMLFGQEANTSIATVTSIETAKDGLYISGTLKSEKGKELEGWITCDFGNELISVDTDAEGNFNLVLPKEAIGQKITLSFLAKGYHLKELFLETNSSQCYTYEIKLIKYKKPKKRHQRMMSGAYR